jgi:Skp family chaperone for outer membrane proteins
MMPEIGEANIVLKKYQDSLSNAASELEKAFNKKMQDWYIVCNEGMPWPDSIKQLRRKEVIEGVQQIQSTDKICQELAKQKAHQMFIIIKNKFNDVVKKVAEENGYRYVLDLSDEHLQFMPLPPHDNITDLVLCKLNL